MRVAELLGALSLATDLADGFALEKSLRTTVVAVRLARAAGWPDDDVRLAFWATLLRFAGCTGFAHEEGSRYSAGDDIALRRALATVDFGRPSTFARQAVGAIAVHAPLRERVGAVGRLLFDGDAPLRHAHAQCEAGTSLARALGRDDVAEVLRWRDERWDGRGGRGLGAGEALPRAHRVSDVADTAELFAWNHGLAAALDEVRRRRGGQLDPALADLFLADPAALFADIGADSSWDLFLAAEPAPVRLADQAETTRILTGFSQFPDLASVFTLDHSPRVAALAAAAASAAGLSDADAELARRAGLVHDLGRVAIPTGLWEKTAPLTAPERERLRSHGHHTATILRLAPALSSVTEVATATHERGAGAGYPRGARVSDLSRPARLLAAADVFVALGSRRPHRAALGPEAASRTLLALGRDGDLDPAAVRAVLDAAGVATRKRTAWPAGLSDREIEVLRLVAIGRTNAEIGQVLGMSPRTAAKHVTNVYTKVGRESRAGLALYAVEHDLLEPS